MTGPWEGFNRKELGAKPNDLGQEVAQAQVDHELRAGYYFDYLINRALEGWVELSSGHRWVLSCDFGGGVIFRALVKLSSLDRSAAYDGLFELTAQWQAAFSRGTGQTLGSNSFGWSDLSG